MKPTALIADDHVPLRRGVRLALEHGGFRVVAEACDADTAVEEAEHRRPDVCLLDVHIPGGGINAAATIAARVPTTKIVMLSVARDDAFLFASLKAGATGYLLKETDPHRLVEALQGALKGEAAIHPSLVARLIAEFRLREGRDPRRRALEAEAETPLTDREWEVLRHLGEGRGTDEIAQLLGVRPVTIRTYVATVLAKLRVSNRAAAVRRLRGLPGLVDDPR